MADAEAIDQCALKRVDAERVDAVRRRLPDEATVAELAETFALLADPGRLRLLDLALEHVHHGPDGPHEGDG